MNTLRTPGFANVGESNHSNGPLRILTHTASRLLIFHSLEEHNNRSFQISPVCNYLTRAALSGIMECTVYQKSLETHHLLAARYMLIYMLI